jgi:TfoX/Sxy family transcriptional regulator of competence genes
VTSHSERSDTNAAVDPVFAPIVDAYAADPLVTAGRMMASFGLKVNGKIFVMFVKGRFVAKLPKSRVDELVASGEGERFDPGRGRLMKEWASLDADSPGLLELAGEAYRFVRGPA